MAPQTSNKGGAGILIRKNLINNIEIIDNNKLLTCTYNECNKCKVESMWIKLKTNNNDTVYWDVSTVTQMAIYLTLMNNI